MRMVTRMEDGRWERGIYVVTYSYGLKNGLNQSGVIHYLTIQRCANTSSSKSRGSLPLPVPSMVVIVCHFIIDRLLPNKS